MPATRQGIQALSKRAFELGCRGRHEGTPGARIRVQLHPGALLFRFVASHVLSSSDWSLNAMPRELSTDPLNEARPIDWLDPCVSKIGWIPFRRAGADERRT